MSPYKFIKVYDAENAMITIITEMTDEELFKTYWMPLICKYREFKFIFAKTDS